MALGNLQLLENPVEKCSLRELLAKASPLRSGDVLAGIAAENEEERIRAQMALADVPLKRFLSECVVPYETDEVTRLIMDSHDAQAFAPVSSFTVGQLRDWLLTPAADTATLTALAPGLTPEMVAAASKLMRIQDLVLVASKCGVVTRFRDTIGLPGRFSSRLQPNHPTDDARGVLASVIDGLQYGSGDAVIGINPASDSLPAIGRLLRLLDDVIVRYGIPTQSCVLTHVTNTLEMIRRGVPVDLCFQSIAGTEKANASFGISLSLLDEAWDATLSLKRGTVGDNVMYFETGQGSALSAGAHFGVDQQTLECRAYAVARRYRPLLVNTVVGFIGPEYLFNGKQIIRAGLEDHCCGKLLGLPMGEDVCYTNHAEADQDDMDMLLTLLGVAGCNFVMGIPGADDIMLGYQSTSFHDVAWLRRVLGKRPAPEFEAWLERMGILSATGELLPPGERRGMAALGRELEEAVMATKQDMLAGAAPAIVTPDPWEELRRFTDARIGLGHCGVSLPVKRWLEFRLAHARARDAVMTPLDEEQVRAGLAAHGLECLSLSSAVADRNEYLTRPDKGRRLSVASRQLLDAWMDAHPGSAPDVSVVICDGLSARAVHENAVPFASRFLEEAAAAGLSAAPVTLVKFGRVAVGDDVAALLNARLVVVLVGERPGLSSPDSLGVYMTHAPTPGLTDEARNCISNVRAAGLPVEEAVRKLCYLVENALVRRLSGVDLKDDVPPGYLPFAETRALG